MPRGFYPEPEYQEYRGRYGGYGRYGYQPRSIADLITEGGRFQSDAHLRSGDIWARAAESIGQQLSGALTQSAEKKALRKRDEAFLSAASSWDGKDPQELLGSLKMFRPEEAMEMAKGIIGFRNLQAAPNEPTRESVDAVGKGLARNSYDVFTQVYPTVKDVMRPGLQKFYGVKELPDEPTRELYETTRVLFGAAPMQKTVTTPGPTGPVERLVGEDELRAGVPVYQEPKEGKEYEVEAPGPGGVPVKKLVSRDELKAGVPIYREPKGGGDEPLMAVIGPDGQPVYAPRSQAVGKRPASNREQGRPVTSGDANRLADFDTSLDDLNTLTREVGGMTGTGSRIGVALPDFVTDLTGWGADSKSRQAAIDRVKQVIGKALEGGVLRKEDEEKYKKILPTIGDPADVAAAKINGLWDAIILRRQTLIENLDDAGYDTSKYTARRPREREADRTKAKKVGRFTVEIE